MVFVLQSNYSCAAALKHAGKVLRLRMSRIQRAQRSSGLSKLAAKAQKARTACGNSLAQAFHWYVHARTLDDKLAAEHGIDFVSLQLGDLAADVRSWLSNRWLRAHCTTSEAVTAAVALALTALLGASGVIRTSVFGGKTLALHNMITTTCF